MRAMALTPARLLREGALLLLAVLLMAAGLATARVEAGHAARQVALAPHGLLVLCMPGATTGDDAPADQASLCDHCLTCGAAALPAPAAAGTLPRLVLAHAKPPVTGHKAERAGPTPLARGPPHLT
jgi:hypothetical protein